MFVRNFYFLIFFLLFNFYNSAYSLPTYINPDTWEEKPPALANLNLYDELLLETVPRFWHNISPSGYNLGTKIEIEVMIWEGKNFCAYVAYSRVYDPDWAGGVGMLGANLEHMFKQNTNSN